MTAAALIAAVAVATGAPAHATIDPGFALRDGQVRIAVHGVRGTIVDARFVGGVASKGKWLNWVRLLPNGSNSWYTVLRAPGYYGTYPVQLKVDGKLVDTDATLGILPKHFEKIPAYWSPTDVAAWWANGEHAKLLAVTTWQSGYFTHRDTRLNRLLRVRTQAAGRLSTLYLSISRLAVNRPWRLVQTAEAP